jgi:hypothetical protein
VVVGCDVLLGIFIMNIEYVIEKLEKGWTFTWIKCGSVDYIQTGEGIEVLYPQDIRDMTVFNLLHTTDDLITELKGKRKHEPAWSDDNFKPPPS